MTGWLRRIPDQLASLLVAKESSARSWKHETIAIVLVIVSGCTTVPFGEPKNESNYFTDTALTELGQWSALWVEAHDGDSGFYPLAAGTDAMAVRLGIAEKAQKSIDLQYFIMKGDAAGLAIFKLLLIAADCGVRVRVLLDDIWTSASDRKLVLLNEHPNIEVRLFNPISRSGPAWLNAAFDFHRANRRMHNKNIQCRQRHEHYWRSQHR